MVRAWKENRKPTEGSDLMKQLKDKFRWQVDTEKIREYYGDEVAIYYEWLNVFQNHLFYPGLLSVLVFITNNTLYDSTNSPTSALFSIFMTFWGTHFFVNWKRHEQSLNILWGDYANADFKIQHHRKQFRGKMSISPVTDKPDLAFGFKQRLPLYLFSVAVCIPCLIAAAFVIICFLNASGTIRPDHHGGAFDMPFLSRMADEGAIFDPNTTMNFVPCILQTVVTMVMNFQFRKVAKWTCDLENHKYQDQYDKSLFIKRFIFECSDFMMYLFYIGLYQREIVALRTNLTGLFMVDQIRRVVCEVLIPYLTQNKDKLEKQVKQKL